MKTIGFPVTRKENENRRVLTLESLRLIEKPENVFIESGYGEVIGISDEDYRTLKAKIVKREKVFEQDIVCNHKAGSPSEFDAFKEGQIIFGWIHAVQGRAITEFFIENKLTGYAWEDMYYKGRHVFWENNVIAGEAALIHALTIWGRIDNGVKVAVIGRGNIAQGAIRYAEKLGFSVDIYNRHMESLLRENVDKYDIIVNGVLWDTSRKDHILYVDDVKRMKPGAMIVDISCDDRMAIETSYPTSFENPTFVAHGVLHYVVDHTPSLLYKTASKSISMLLPKYINQLMKDMPDADLQKAKIFEDGKIIDDRIKKFQNRD
jgi:N5-(carboxyethyl)ornithine synthase